MPDPDAKHDARLATYAATATAVSLLSDRRLGDLLAAARPAGSGIGGSTAGLDVDGVRVFVKQIPLTDLEQRSEHAMSTANLFGLPAFYQYPLGSAGFGSEREFLSRHRAYDRCGIVTGLACSLIASLRGAQSPTAFLREWTEGSAPRAAGLSPQAAAMLTRYAPPALLTLDFHQALSAGPKDHAVPGRGHRALAPARPALTVRCPSRTSGARRARR